MIDDLRLLPILVVIALCTTACLFVQLKISDKAGNAALIVMSVCNVMVWVGVAMVGLRAVW